MSMKTAEWGWWILTLGLLTWMSLEIIWWSY